MYIYIYEINLNRESEFSYKGFTLTVGVRLPDDPLRWNFSRRILTRDLS